MIVSLCVVGSLVGGVWTAGGVVPLQTTSTLLAAQREIIIAYRVGRLFRQTFGGVLASRLDFFGNSNLRML